MAIKGNSTLSSSGALGNTLDTHFMGRGSYPFLEDVVCVLHISPTKLYRNEVLTFSIQIRLSLHNLFPLKKKKKKILSLIFFFSLSISLIHSFIHSFSLYPPLFCPTFYLFILTSLIFFSFLRPFLLSLSFFFLTLDFSFSFLLSFFFFVFVFFFHSVSFQFFTSFFLSFSFFLYIISVISLLLFLLRFFFHFFSFFLIHHLFIFPSSLYFSK